MEWRTKRKIMYIGIPLLVILLVGSFLMWRALSSTSCTDGKQNGGELGIDCEGGCPNICLARIIQPQVEWSRFDEVLAGRYNIVALIDNPNKDLRFQNTPVTLTAWSKGAKIWTNDVRVNIGPNKKTAVFKGPIILKEQPDRITAEISSVSPEKAQVNDVPGITLRDSSFEDLNLNPIVKTDIMNNTNFDQKNVELVIALLDGDNNAVHLSRTVVPSIVKRSPGVAVFSWPRPFSGTQGICSQPFASMMIIDRSGSMNSDSINPPQPMESVKEAALSFARKMGTSDEVGVVSFATDATLNSAPRSQKSEILSALNAISILPDDENGYTNIGDALEIARQALSASSKPSKSMILLTDGKPNWPEKPTGEEYALSFADKIRDEGIPLFAIGLGAQVEQSFLEAVTGDPTRVFLAPETEQLSNIYSQIATRICERVPFRVEIYSNVDNYAD